MPSRPVYLTSLPHAAGFNPDRADPAAESEIYKEIQRRMQDAGEGWRDRNLAWTPSFLPYLVGRMSVYKEGPEVLLERAKDLAESPAVEKYRKLRRDLLSEDAEDSADARESLSSAADEMARKLGSNRREMEVARHVLVEVLPKAFGGAAGAGFGAAMAGPPGAYIGTLAGVAGEEVLREAHRRLWGWFVDYLPFRSARKLLSQSVRSEYELRDDLGGKLKNIWESGK